jgi:hypothetical protein
MLFALRIITARAAAGRQRSVDLSRFLQMKSDHG